MRENFGKIYTSGKAEEKVDPSVKPEVNPEKEDVQSQEELERIRQEYSKLEKWGNVLLGVSGWRMKIDPNIKTAAADYEGQTLYFGTRTERMISSDTDFKAWQKRNFIKSHELMHLAQAMENPEVYLGTFDSAKAKAKEYAGEYGLLRSELKQTFDRFYNIFLDVDDNGRTIRRNKNLQKEEGQEAVHELYQDLFSSSDLTQLPLNEQFMSGIMMQVMEKNRMVRLSDEVEEFLQKPVSYLGKEHNSFLDFVREEIHAPEVDFKKTVFRIDRVVRPAFEDFLKKDIENGNYQPPAEMEYDIDGGISEEMLKDFAKNAKRAKEEKAKSKKDKMAEKLQKDFEAEKKENGFSSGEIRRMDEITKNTNDVWPDMMDLWEEFFSKSFEYERREEGWYKSGEFLTKKFVKNLPQMMSDGQINEKVFTRKRAVEKRESWKPRKISFVFSIDLSGSMNPEQKQAMQEVIYSIYRSFLQFQRNKIVASDDQDLPVMGDLEMIGYGDNMEMLFIHSTEEKKQRMIDPRDKSLENRFWKALLRIGKLNLGSTDNYQPLRYAQRLANDRREQLDGEEEIMLFLEMTDGDPNEDVIANSKDAVTDLNKRKSVYCKSIRFGGGSNDFQSIWKGNGTPLVNMDVNRLKKAFMKVLKEVFK